MPLFENKAKIMPSADVCETKVTVFGIPGSY
jgi:hypothetical protein